MVNKLSLPMLLSGLCPLLVQWWTRLLYRHCLMCRIWWHCKTCPSQTNCCKLLHTQEHFFQLIGWVLSLSSLLEGFSLIDNQFSLNLGHKYKHVHLLAVLIFPWFVLMPKLPGQSGLSDNNHCMPECLSYTPKFVTGEYNTNTGNQETGKPISR